MRNCYLVLLLACLLCIFCSCESGGGSGSSPAPAATATATTTPTPSPSQSATLTGTWYGAARYDNGWPSQNAVVKVVPFDGGYFFIATYHPASLTVKTVVYSSDLKVGDTFRTMPVDKSSNNWGLCTWVAQNRIIGDMYAGSVKVGQVQITR